MRISDWSSDVCSSDLAVARLHHPPLEGLDDLDVVGGSDRLDRPQQLAHRDVAVVGDVARDIDAGGRIALLVALDEIGDAGEVQVVVPGGAEYAEHGVLAEAVDVRPRSEEHTSELQSLMRISYAVFCLQQKNTLNEDNSK